MDTVKKCQIGIGFAVLAVIVGIIILASSDTDGAKWGGSILIVAGVFCGVCCAYIWTQDTKKGGSQLPAIANGF